MSVKKWKEEKDIYEVAEESVKELLTKKIERILKEEMDEEKFMLREITTNAMWKTGNAILVDVSVRLFVKTI